MACGPVHFSLSPLWGLLYPPRCATCRRRGEWLCDSCLQLCVHHGAGCCTRCGCRATGFGCSTCARYIRHIDGFQAAFNYSGPVRDLVHRFKYDGLHAAAAWMAEQMPSDDLLPDTVLVPVPLHTSRQKERGYNQSELLARALSRRTGLRTADALARVRPTSPQAHQNAPGRWLNVRDAFEPRPNLDARVVALVDDVCTSSTRSITPVLVLTGRVAA